MVCYSFLRKQNDKGEAKGVKMEKEYFILNGINYNVVDAILDLCETDEDILLSFGIEAESEEFCDGKQYHLSRQ